MPKLELQIYRARDFTRPQDYGSFSVVRLYNAHIRPLGGRHAWVRIDCNENTVFRRVRGAGGGTGLSDDAMELDYDSRQELGIYGSYDAESFVRCDAKIRPASFLDKLRAHWRHPDIQYRVPYQLAVLSAALGILGMLLGVLSLVLAV